MHEAARTALSSLAGRTFALTGRSNPALAGLGLSSPALHPTLSPALAGRSIPALSGQET